MGLVKKDKEGDDAGKADDAEQEDPPTVKTLKEIDDRYMALEREYEKEVMRLQVEYTRKQQPFLEERKKLLVAGDTDGPKTGTPALSGFWLKAMKNHPGLAEFIEEWDEPVLEFLTDVEKSYVDEENTEKGFKLTFRFAENPYFTNTEIEKEYRCEDGNPYLGEIQCKEVRSGTISWKAGKDVTVERVAKKVKGGGAKKAKQKKEKEEARPSFFRVFFRTIAPDCQLAEDAVECIEAMGGCAEDPDALQFLLDQDLEGGTALRDHVIPYAVHWYTGEAIPKHLSGDSDDDDDDDDDDEDDSEEEEESEDEPPAKGRAKSKAKAKGKGGGKGGAQ